MTDPDDGLVNGEFTCRKCGREVVMATAPGLTVLPICSVCRMTPAEQEAVVAHFALRPCVVVTAVDEPTLVFSLAEAVAILGETDANTLVGGPFKTGFGQRGIWFIPHPDRER